MRKLRYLIEKSFNKVKLKVPLTISQTLFLTDRLLRHYSMGYGTKYSRMGRNISKILSSMVVLFFQVLLGPFSNILPRIFLSLSLSYALFLLFTTFQSVLINNNKKLYKS